MPENLPKELISARKEAEEFIENVLEFNDIVVEEVMTPRVAIEGLEMNMTVQEAVDFVIKHSHSRIPVYDGDLDSITGVISIKELLKFFDEGPRTRAVASSYR